MRLKAYISESTQFCSRLIPIILICVHETWIRLCTFFTFFWHDTSKNVKSHVFWILKKRKNVFSNNGVQWEEIKHKRSFIAYMNSIEATSVGFQSNCLIICKNKAVEQVWSVGNNKTRMTITLLSITSTSSSSAAAEEEEASSVLFFTI